MLILSFPLFSFFLEFEKMEILLDVGHEYTCYREARQHPDSEIDTHPFFICLHFSHFEVLKCKSLHKAKCHAFVTLKEN